MEAVVKCRDEIVAFLAKEHGCISNLLDSMLQRFLCACENAINECCFEVQGVQDDWLVKRDVTIEALEKFIAILNKVQFECNVSNIVGSSVGIVGGTLSIIGLALAPFTLGASLIMTGVGIGTGLAGGLTSLGAVLANYGITKVEQSEINAIFKEDSDVTVLLSKPLNSLLRVITDVKNISARLDGSCHGQQLYQLLRTTEQLFEGTCFEEALNTATTKATGRWDLSVIPLMVPRAISSVDDMTALATGAFTPAARITGGILSAITVTINVYSLVVTSIDVSNGSKIKDNDKLQKQLEQLKTEREQLKEVFAKLKSAMLP